METTTLEERMEPKLKRLEVYKVIAEAFTYEMLNKANPGRVSLVSVN